MCCSVIGYRLLVSVIQLWLLRDSLHLTIGIPKHVLGGGGPKQVVQNVFWTPLSFFSFFSFPRAGVGMPWAILREMDAGASRRHSHAGAWERDNGLSIIVFITFHRLLFAVVWQSNRWPPLGWVSIQSLHLLLNRLTP